jgi:hypothetical protein
MLGGGLTSATGTDRFELFRLAIEAPFGHMNSVT